MIGTAVKANLKDILALRALYLQETNFQIRYNAVLERGWSDSYLLRIEGKDAGYGSIKGQERNDRDTIFEFYVVPPFRKQASLLFQELIYHIKGRVGAAILCRCMELGWFKRERDTRALKLTPAGRAGLASTFGVELGDADQPAAATGGSRALLRA